jgi:ketosteroid isomerase-like protein
MNPARLSKIESAMRLVLEFNEAFNRHDVGGMMKLMSGDCIFENTHPAPDGTRFSGKETVTKFWEEFFRESPHARIEIEEIFGMGSRCIMRWRYEWTDAVGQKGHVRGVDVFKVEDGLIVEKLSYVKG